MFEAVHTIDATAAIQPLPLASRAIVRCRDADIALVSERLGIVLPHQACASTKGSDLSALWLGPDEWLLLSDSPEDNWGSDLVERLDGVLCSLVDVSHRQIGMMVQGDRAEGILATGCALDLSLDAFPVGMCTRTMFAKAEVVLWRTGSDSFHLEVWRSFARYVNSLLCEAETEA
jgi:sarcosine oxidase subunit gamma